MGFVFYPEGSCHPVQGPKLNRYPFRVHQVAQIMSTLQEHTDLGEATGQVNRKGSEQPMGSPGGGAHPDGPGKAVIWGGMELEIP